MRIGADDPDLASAMRDVYPTADRLVFVDAPDGRLGRAFRIVGRGFVYLFVLAGLLGGVSVIYETVKALFR